MCKCMWTINLISIFKRLAFKKRISSNIFLNIKRKLWNIRCKKS